MTLFATLTLAVAVTNSVAGLGAPRGHANGSSRALPSTATSCSALLVGPWALLSVYLRPGVVIAMIAAIAAAAYRCSRTTSSTSPPRLRQRRFVFQSTTFCLFGLVLLDGLAGRLAPSRTIDLHFPWTVAVCRAPGETASSRSFHHWFPSDRFGLDLVKLNAFGNRARGIAPGSLNDYVSYDVAVHSPCNGIVEEAVGNLPDNSPGETDSQNISGNHVLLRCGALRVLLAHFRSGSVAVSPGDSA